MENNVSLDLMEFIEQQILPRYAAFDKAHSMEHVTGVIRRSLTIARRAGADLDMAYAIAAYHDLGLEGPRAIHHLTSGKILMADARLKRWFSPEQMKIMKEAVEDHRASASHTPRNIYGKIVAEADRDLEPMSVFRRTIQFGLSHYPEKTPEEHWQRSPSSSDFHTIPRRLPKSIGSDSWPTWTRNIQPTATSACGCPIRLTKKN